MDLCSKELLRILMSHLGNLYGHVVLRGIIKATIYSFGFTNNTKNSLAY